MPKGQFEKWFVAQFGKRPSKNTIFDLRADVMMAENRRSEAEHMLHRTLEYEAKLNAARLTRNAAEKKFKFEGTKWIKVK